MLKLIGSVMIFGSCAALGLNARRELRRRVAAADAMLLALRLMENEITAHRTPMPEIIDLLAKNENAVIRQIFSGVRRRMRERSGLSLSYLWCAGMRAAQADAGLGREECGVLCDAANFLGRYDASEQKAAIDTALHRLQMLRELAFAELRDRGSLYRTCGIAAGARPVMLKFLEEIQKRNLQNVTVSQTGCIGMCRLEPMLDVIMPGKEKVTYVRVNPDMVPRIVAEHIVNGRPVQEYTIGAAEGE